MNKRNIVGEPSFPNDPISLSRAGLRDGLDAQTRQRVIGQIGTWRIRGKRGTLFASEREYFLALASECEFFPKGSIDE